MPPSRKGQVFIVTMVFLIALIFTVQQLLFQYSAVDLSAPPQSPDTYFMKNMESAFKGALDSSTECGEARKNIEELKETIIQDAREGYIISIDGGLDCPGGGWPSPPELELTVTTRGETSETRSSMEFYHGYIPVCTPTCSTLPGCRTSLENGHTVPGECCGAGDCYECDADYGWNGDECERIWAPETVSCDSWQCRTDITQANTRWAVGSAAESPDVPTIDEQSGDVTYPPGYTADDFPAFKFCEEATYDGHANWRLPTMDELRSIHTDSYTNPSGAYSTLDQIYPDILRKYWSSEQGAAYDVAHDIDFMNPGPPPGGEGQTGKGYCCNYLICTRSLT